MRGPAAICPGDENERPNRVLVSEFMLQQTRVETVVPYYTRWMRRFPDWEALAAASQDDVLREWQGLGYYSRARNLHRAAGIVRERYGGVLPAEPSELRKLPGVGEYTARGRGEHRLWGGSPRRGRQCPPRRLPSSGQAGAFRAGAARPNCPHG